MRTIRILILAAVLGFSKPSNGQVFRVGPQAGETFSTITNDSARTVKASAIGASYVAGLTEHVALEGGIAYTRKGGEWERIYEEIHKFNDEVKLHYVEAPVLLSWFFNGDKKRFRPSVGLGATPAYLVKGQFTTQYNNTETGYYMEPESTNKTKHYKRFDLGVTGAAGVNYRLRNRSWLSARVGYTVGRLPLYLGRELTPVTNRNLFVNASWQLPVGKYHERGYMFR